MKLTELLLAELDREAPKTRRALEQVPKGKDDWKPHPKSMPLLRLAGLVAAMPSWVPLILDQESLELNPPKGQGQYQQPTVDQLVSIHDGHVKKAREALSKRNDDYLMKTKWALQMNGKTVWEDFRYVVLQDTMNHLAHHRGQLTVYLRLAGATVPAIYGPSADDQRFA